MEIKKNKFVWILGCIVLCICLLFNYNKAFASSDSNEFTWLVYHDMCFKVTTYWYTNRDCLLGPSNSCSEGKEYQGDFEVPNIAIENPGKVDEKRIPCKGIDQEAFNNCNNLTSVTLLQGNDWIGKHAFSNCQNLKKIIIKGKYQTPVILDDDDIIVNCPNLHEIEVPYGCANSYKWDKNWKKYENMITEAKPDNLCKINCQVHLLYPDGKSFKPLTEKNAHIQFQENNGSVDYATYDNKSGNFIFQLEKGTTGYIYVTGNKIDTQLIDYKVDKNSDLIINVRASYKYSISGKVINIDSSTCMGTINVDLEDENGKVIHKEYCPSHMQDQISFNFDDISLYLNVKVHIYTNDKNIFSTDWLTVENNIQLDPISLN